MQEDLEEGTRVGRYVVLRDLDGRTQAIASGAASAVCETDEGSLLLLPGGRLVHVGRPIAIVLDWLAGSR